MSEWKEISIDQIKADSKSSIAVGPFGSKLKSEEYIESGIPVIRGMNISSSKEFSGEFVFISEEKAKTLGSANVYPGDIVFPHRGAIGEVGIVNDQGNKHYVISSSLMKLTPNKDKAHSEFLYYFFKSNKGKYELLKNASTVGTPGIGQPLASLKAINLKLPPLPEQKAIAHILGTLDDKIKLNRQMNQILEAMAQALFKSWFVDFDPVIDNALAQGKEIPEELEARAEKRKGLSDSKKLLSTNPSLAAQFPASFVFNETLGKWIPEGWEVKSFGEEFDITMGQSPPGTSYNEEGIGKPFFQGKTDFGFRFPENRIYCTDPKREAKKNDTLISVRAPVGNANLASSDCIIGRGLCAVRHASNSISFTYYSVLQLKEVFDVFEGEGTVFGSINQTSLKGIPVIRISNQIIESFEKVAGILDQKIEINTNQIGTLTQLRDRLLPELISGRVRVPKG